MTEGLSRRRHEKLPGEATILGLLPTGYTLLGVIVAGAFYVAISYTQIGSNAADIEKMRDHLERQTGALNDLNTAQRLLGQKVDNFVERQQARDKRQDEREAEASKTRLKILEKLER